MKHQESRTPMTVLTTAKVPVRLTDVQAKVREHEEVPVQGRGASSHRSHWASYSPNRIFSKNQGGGRSVSFPLISKVHLFKAPARVRRVRLRRRC